AADPLMKIAVACLGAGVNIGLLILLGWPVLITIIAIMAMTIGSGLWLGRLMGRTPAFAILSAGAVAICGASAALALCCVLPATANRERDLSVVIIVISLLSAAGVLLYPLLMQILGLSDFEAGFVLGGSLHNVAQAVAAGFSMSEPTGETATLVKMIRVSLLAPCVMIVAFAFRHAPKTQADEVEPCEDAACGDETAQRRRILPPAFLIVFFVLMIISSAGLMPWSVRLAFDQIASIGLVLAMTAIGLSTPVADLAKTDRRSVWLILLQTAIILVLALCALTVLDL
ncbi:MAG: putative sulfate exporter family transporter, partial [Pseudomonadota bacterium]